MPDRHGSSPSRRSRERSSVDVDLLVPEWRQALDLLEGATESSLEELGALREQLAGSLRSMRETRYWDAARSEEAVERLTTSLQAAERRLEEQAEGLSERQADAMEYAATIAHRLASALERLSPGKGGGGGGTPADLEQLVDDVRAAVASDISGVSRKLAGAVAKRLAEVERRLAQATAEAASTGQEAAEKALEELRDSFGEVRGSLQELRAIHEESGRPGEATSAPVRQALDELKGSLGEMSSAVGRDLAERVTELTTGQAAVERLAESVHGEVQGIGERFRELLDERLSERVSVPLAAFVERLTALEARMDQAARDSFEEVHTRLAEVEGAATSASGSVQRGVEALRESIHKIASSAGRDVAELRSRVAAVDEQLGVGLQAIETRFEGLLDERLSGLEERMASSSGPLLAGLDDRVAALTRDIAAIRGGLASALATTRTGLSQELAAAREALASELGAIREQLPGELGTLVEASEGRMAARLVDGVAGLETRLEAETASLHEELAAERDRMASATKRVDRVADVIESLGRRRGFRELVETEQAAQQEQAAFIERLSATADRLGSVLREAESRIGAAAAAAAGELRDPEIKEALGRVASMVSGLQEQLPAALVGMTTEMRSELRQTDQAQRGLAEVGAGLEAHLARVEGALDEGLLGLSAKLAALKPGRDDGPQSTAATRELAKATTAVRAELKALRGRIESWGKPRTAPRLAQEVTELGARFDALERAVEETLAASVARKVHASVDRRLRATLAQLTERNPGEIVDEVPPPEASNGPAAAPETGTGRPRRFRRRGA